MERSQRPQMDGVDSGLFGLARGHPVCPRSSALGHFIYNDAPVWVEIGSSGNLEFARNIPVALGAALLIWVLVVGISQTPKRVKLRLTPAVLMSRGPYTFTRNPMYVAELGIWMGWALFFGSMGVFAAALLLWAVVSFVILPREELTLEAAFGQVYLQYKDRTPRWL